MTSRDIMHKHNTMPRKSLVIAEMKVQHLFSEVAKNAHDIFPVLKAAEGFLQVNIKKSTTHSGFSGYSKHSLSRATTL